MSRASQKRRRWLDRRRKRKDRVRPLPLEVIVVNCMSVSAGPARAKDVLRNAADRADVILASECDDFDGRAVLPERTWDVVHSQAADADGVLIAIRRDRGRIRNPRWHYGSPAGYAVARRKFVTADLVVDAGTRHRWNPVATSGHAPPKRAWANWPGYMRRVRATKADMAGADWNKLGRAVEPALGRRVRAHHILGLAVRWWIPASKARAVNVGGDHLAVLVTLWPRRNR